MNIGYYESVEDCGESFILEGEHNAVVFLFCDECNERHQFKITELFQNFDDLWEFIHEIEQEWEENGDF